jgi:signal transduction histidine kinase
LKGYVYQDPQGNLYAAGGANYYVAFHPREVGRINSEPRVYFTDFKIFNHSHSELLEEAVIRLNHAQNYFSLEFSAPDFSGDNIQYAYRLEGLDSTWTEAGKRTFASYANLPAGQYRFSVRASNWKGSFGTKTTSVRISITPPFWQQAWFIALCVGLIASLGYALYRYRINELLKRQAIRNGIAQDLHDHIGSTLSSISVYSQVAAIYQEQHKTEQLRQVLHTIGETSNEMIGEMADIVWTIQPKNDQMESIVKRIESYARPLCRAKNIAFALEVDPQVYGLTLDMLVRKNLYLIIKEAITNSLKYADCSNLRVHLGLSTNHAVELTIEDDGCGFDAQARLSAPGTTLSGNGLDNMRRRAREMKARLAMKSIPGRGTRIQLRMGSPYVGSIVSPDSGI